VLIQQMLQRHAEAPDRLLVTEQNHVAGPPVLFPRDCFPALRTLSGSRGAHALIEQEAARVERFASTNNMDVDTPLDLQRVHDWLAIDRPPSKWPRPL
jgi:molybdenum cofactor cytidylyltransferase